MLKNIFIKKILNEDETTLKIKILGGLICIKQNLCDYSSEFRFLGICLIASKTDSLITKYFLKLPKIPLFKKNIATNIVKELETYIPENTDAFFFSSRSGEFFLMMHHFQELMRNYKTTSDKVVVLTPFKYHLSIFSLFYPDIKIIQVPFKFAQINRNITKHIFNLDAKRRVIVPILFTHYLQIENKLKNKENIHFYDFLKSNHNLTDSKITTPKLDSNTIAKVEDKIKKINLDIDNFVILSLDSVSNQPIEQEFALTLINKLLEAKIDIYFNSLTNNEITQYGKTCYMTHAETFYLTQKAKAVIGLRSGFMDTIVETSQKTICLYTDFKNRPIFNTMNSEDVLRGFTLKKLPNVNPNNIFEFDVNKYTNDSLITKIMEVLQ